MNPTQAQALLEINGRLLAVHPDIPVSVYSTFLAVVKLQPSSPHALPPTVFEVSQVAGIPYTSVSRHLRILSPYRVRKDRNGVGLITTFVNPDDNREKLVVLSRSGRALANSMGIFLKRLAA